MRILILGGTSEGSALARALGGDRRFDVTLSLAGRTGNPVAQPVPVRSGGFGGSAGLAAYLEGEAIAAVVDATHPYAVRISANAVAACRSCAVPLFSVIRPPWRAAPGDDWIEVPDPQAAARALGGAPQRVFLSLGRLELKSFAAAPHHDYIARTIEPPGAIALPPRIRFITARGPFDEACERAFLASESIAIIVSKNSGGAMTYGKIAAARALGLPVVMIARPLKATGDRTGSVEDAVAWLMDWPAHGALSVSRRGV